MRWHTLLVLGGIGSGKSQYAESLLAGSPSTPDPAGGTGVTDPAGGADATAASGADGGVRRVTPEPGADLPALARALAEAKPDEVLLVDELTGWLPTGGRADRAEKPGAEIDALVAAVRACPARLVLVSSEVGLSTPSTAANRRLADALGALNHAVAEATDAVVLVVAGQPSWLKGGGAAVAAPGAAAVAAATAAALPAEDGAPDLANLTGLPSPDEAAKTAATEHLAALGTFGLGQLAEVVRFAAGCQGTAVPAAWRRVRVLALHGDHRGAAAAGAPGSAARADALRAGTDPLAQLAGPPGASVQLVPAAVADPIEDGPAMPDTEVEPALAYGWRLAEQAADEGVDAIVLASIGDGAETAAAAVAAVLVPSTEPALLLARVRTSGGTIDDEAWMRRCAAARDAVHRARSASHTTGRPVLAALGGADLAIAAGVLLGAAARRTPVLLDGPVGAAAGLVARNLAAASRRWWLLPDDGGHPLVAKVKETLGLTPVLDLRLELGEGAGALMALPVLQTALAVAASAPTAARTAA